jgi:hypothetical protein
MPWVGFERTIPAFERAKTVHALDRAATLIDINIDRWHEIMNEHVSMVSSSFKNRPKNIGNPGAGIWISKRMDVYKTADSQYSFRGRTLNLHYS